MYGHDDHPAILASDAERDRALGLLHAAVVEGRLTLEEFGDRVDRVHRARTDRDLAAVTADVPGPEVKLAIYNLFGTVTIRVPPGVAVEVDGGGAFASQVIDPPPWPAPAGAPRLRIHVKGPGGTLYVRSAEPRTTLATGERAGFLPRPPGS